MDGEGLPAAVGALMLGIDAHQRGAAQVPDLVGILGGVHDRSTGHGRVEVAQHGHGTLVIARHDDMSACMPRMVDERGAVMRLVAIMVEMVCERVRDHRDRGTVLAEAAVGFVRLRDQHVAASGMPAVQYRSPGCLDGAADGVAGIGQLPGSGMNEDVG